MLLCISSDTTVTASAVPQHIPATDGKITAAPAIVCSSSLYSHVLMQGGADRRSGSQMARIFSISYDTALLRSREFLLRQMGYSVTSADGLVEAMELCEKDPENFDLIILGHSIPHEDKRTIIKRCRRTRRCPVLALTL